MIRAHLTKAVHTIVQSDLDRPSCIWRNKAQLPPLPVILAWYRHPPHFRDFTGFMQVDLNPCTSHDLVLISLNVEEGGQLVQIATSHRADCHGKDRQRYMGTGHPLPSRKERSGNTPRKAEMLP